MWIARLTDEMTGIVEENASAIGGFIGDLVAAFPDLTQENMNVSPWSSPIYHNSECVIVTISWPRRREVAETLLNLAIRHGMTAYDPQNQELHRPGSAVDHGRG